jgi:tetratricopeptide (TPR) repeat protein
MGSKHSKKQNIISTTNKNNVNFSSAPVITTTNVVEIKPTYYQPPPPVILNQIEGGAYVGGISLKYIINLICNSSTLSRHDTMEDLVCEVIKPATKDKQESYLQKLAREQPSKVKPTADHFVSYVWGYELVNELLASLKYTLLEKPKQEDVFIWLDGFCVNQHQVSNGITATPEQLQTTFGESLKAIGSVVMVLVNWRKPTYSNRIWCVFEAFMAKKSNTKVILAMSENEEESLVQAMVGNGIYDGFLLDLFGNVDVETAKAKEPQDQEAILQLIRQYGVADVNAVILDNLKQWLVQVGDFALKNASENSQEAGRICGSLYMIHDALGELDTALEWAQKSLEIKIKLHGPEHQNVATAYNNIAACSKELGRFDDALAANEKDWAICSKILGISHPNTIRCRFWKANILQAQGKLEESLVIRDEVLQMSRDHLGVNDEYTTLARNHKADCLRQLKRYDEALVLFNEVVEWSIQHAIRNQLGENQPFLADRFNYKAQCLQEMGHAEDALPLCSQALDIFMKTMGSNNSFVAVSAIIKGKCLDDLHRSSEALELFNQALKIRVKFYKGYENANVAEALHCKAVCLKHLGQLEEANDLGKQSVEIYERKLGRDHPITGEVRNVWMAAVV